MGERDLRIARVSRRGFLKGLTATVIVAAAGSSTSPAAAEAGKSVLSLAVSPTPPGESLYQDPEFEESHDDDSPLEGLDPEALVIEEDNSPDFLRLNLAADPNCRAQFRATSQKYTVTNPAGRTAGPDGVPRYRPGDKLEPLPDRTFRATGFLSQRRTIRGVSTANEGGDVLFTADPQKRPARSVEFKGMSNDDNQMPITVAREGGASRSALVPCNTRKPFPFYSFFRQK